MGTYLLAQKTQIASSVAPYDCVGLFVPTCQTNNPVWRHTFRLTWNTPWNVLASLQWRYIGAASLDSNSSQSTLALLTNVNGGSPAYSSADNKMDEVNYLDLSTAWRIGSTLTLRAGVNNVLDPDAPIISPADCRHR